MRVGRRKCFNRTLHAKAATLTTVRPLLPQPVTLPEAKNATMAPGKRKIETIDLTNSSDNEEHLLTPPRRNKFAKPKVPPSSSQDQKGQSTTIYPTPASSSQPSSSQRSTHGGGHATEFRPSHYPPGVSTSVSPLYSV